MTADNDLSSLFAAERAEAPSPLEAAKAWQEVQGALLADAPALAVAHGPLKLGLSLATKSFVGSGLLAFAVTSGGLGVYASTQATPVAAPSAVAVAVVRTAAPITAPVAVMAQATEPLAQAAPPRAVSAPAVAPSTSAAPAATFGDELRLMKAAKQELDAGRPHLATVWLDQHAQLYPGGVFQSEREGLRVLLHCQQSSAGGRAAAAAFLRQNPRSPLVDRITRACGMSTTNGAAGNFQESAER